MNEFDKEHVFTESVKAGKRIYYFDVKQSRNGDRYISITESKKINDGTPENPHFTYEKHKLFLYKEDYEKFIKAFIDIIKVAKTGVIPDELRYKEEEQNTHFSYADTAVDISAPQESVDQNDETARPDAPVATNADEMTTDVPLSEPKDEGDTFKIDLDF